MHIERFDEYRNPFEPLHRRIIQMGLSPWTSADTDIRVQTTLKPRILSTAHRRDIAPMTPTCYLTPYLLQRESGEVIAHSSQLAKLEPDTRDRVIGGLWSMPPADFQSVCLTAITMCSEDELSLLNAIGEHHPIPDIEEDDEHFALEDDVREKTVFLRTMAGEKRILEALLIKTALLTGKTTYKTLPNASLVIQAPAHEGY